MTRRVQYFSDPLPDGVDARRLLGGKGASLKAMTRAGLRVPPGFTITTDTCAEYLSAGGVFPGGLEECIAENLRRLERETGRQFGRGSKPLLVSVRSGAARSMPGMMDTLLNVGLHPQLAGDLGDDHRFWSLWIQFVLQFVKTLDGVEANAFDEILLGRPASRAVSDALLAACQEKIGRTVPTQPEPILRECIAAVMDSWNNPRAIDYRRRNDIRGLNGTAVNVQMMWPSEVSGIVFTQDPTALEQGRMVIEASLGLGEAVVSGDVSPDRYLVPRDRPTDYTVEVGEKATVFSALGAELPAHQPEQACLADEQVAELVELSLRVEQHFGHPVDIEWGLAGGELALLQSRAIRGLDIAADVEPGRREEIERLRQIAGNSRKVWVAHNLGETLTAPTPLTWDIIRAFMTGAGGFGRLYQTLGYRPSEAIREHGFLELICGRIYADPDRLSELFWDGMPMVYDLDALIEDRSLLDGAPTRFAPERADSRFLLNLPRNLASIFRSWRRMRKLARGAGERFEEQVLPPFMQWVRDERQADLTQLDDGQLLQRLGDRRRRVLDEFAPESLLPGFFGGMALAKAVALLEQIAGPSEGPALAGELTLALEGDITFQQDAMLYDVARGEATLEEFLDRFGHRCLGEMELRNPRWREDDSYLRKLVSRFTRDDARDPRRLHAANAARRREADDDLGRKLADWGGSSFEREIREHLRAARSLLPYRESGKHYLMMGYELIRLAIEEIARRSALGQDVYFLRIGELSAALAGGDGLAEVAAARRIRHASARKLHPADVIDSQQLESLGRPPEVSAAENMPATCLASGVADGPARIVRDPAAADDLGSGYVLVCPSTDPGWTPLFVNAAALVVERGGTLSHGAIVARDFGIPAVSLPDATRLISHGQLLRVDGSEGMVHVLEAGEDRPVGKEAGHA